MRRLLRDIVDYFRHNGDYDEVGVLLLESDQLEALRKNGHLVLEDDLVGATSSWVVSEEDVTIINKKAGFSSNSEL